MRQAVRQLLFAVGRLLTRLPYFKGLNRMVAIVLRHAQKLGPPVVVEIEGFTLQVDLRDGTCRGLWAYRAFPQGIALRGLCRPGDVVIDAGANVGYMSLLAAREVGPTGRVIAIEPAQRAYSLLKVNAERNFPDRILPIRAACDQTEGTVTMYVSEYSEDQSSMRPEPVVGGRYHQEIVPARSLSSLIRELEIVPDLVKIDVEGAEWQVLRGLLQDGVPPPRTMLIEAYAGNTRAFGYLPSEMCAWLRGQGYSLTLSRDTQSFEYSETRADGPLLHDVLAVRVDGSQAGGSAAPS